LQICVFGMGKIGLPLAIQYALKGHSVIGIDIDSERVNLINDGHEPFPGEQDLQESLLRVLEQGLFTATIDASHGVSRSQNIVVAVPLIVNGESEPDFASLDAVTNEIGKCLKPGDLVIYETTLPIGTTRNRFLPTLEKISGLKCPSDFSLIFSPERVLTGRVFEDLRKYPKIVGGISDACSVVGKNFYQSVLDFDIRTDLVEGNGVWVLGSAEAAEFVKLAETTFRDVNISLANQFSLDASRLGLDIQKIIQSANSQPYSNIHNPGISVGGHCIPVYPLLYLSTNPGAELVRVARELNSEMPAKAIKRIQETLGSLSGKTVAILGVSYRSGVKETAFSGAFRLKTELEDLVATPLFIDPLYTSNELRELGFEPTAEENPDVEIVIIHTHYQELLDDLFKIFPNCRLIFDGRGVVNPASLPPLVTLVKI
jgi:UDP-N-acetyl-D-glucosamine dehydrogenase